MEGTEAVGIPGSLQAMGTPEVVAEVKRLKANLQNQLGAIFSGCTCSPSLPSSLPFLSYSHSLFCLFLFLSQLWLLNLLPKLHLRFLSALGNLGQEDDSRKTRSPRRGGKPQYASRQSTGKDSQSKQVHERISRISRTWAYPCKTHAYSFQHPCTSHTKACFSLFSLLSLPCIETLN